MAIRQNRKLSRKEVVKINALLEQHLLPSDKSEGKFKYAEGYSDAEIAKLIAVDVAHTTVANARQELFGHLDTKVAKVTDNEKIEKLEIRVRELDLIISNVVRCYDDVKIKYNKLCESLTINKVLDVKHLRVNSGEAIK